MEDKQPQIEDIVIRRIIAAPVALVWQAWTDPELIVRWWGPARYTSPSAKVELREGGRYIFCMQAPPEQGGQALYNTGTYSRVVPNELLEFTMSLSDSEGNPIDPASIGMPADFPPVIRTRIEFVAIRKDVTELIITEYDWEMGLQAVFSYAGMHESLDKMSLEIGN